MTTIDELIERCRKAEGPDRAIDLHIHACIAQAGQWADSDIQYALSDIEGTTAPPAYTGSLDCIVALIEKEVPGKVYELLKEAIELWAHDAAYRKQRAAVPDLPRFAVLAFLLALQSKETSDAK